MILTIVVALAVTIAAIWIGLAVAVLVGRPSRTSVLEAARFMPDTLRFVWNLARDRAVPRRARWRLYLAFFYNVQPINLIPDFVPVIGFADNLVVTAWALRSAMRLAGPDVVVAHWHGTTEELQTLYRLTRLGTPTSTERPPSIDE
ncbi:MAG TPA: DUF1232 domain-containing protein [Acidimicrobiia bacterium]